MRRSGTVNLSLQLSNASEWLTLGGPGCSTTSKPLKPRNAAGCADPGQAGRCTAACVIGQASIEEDRSGALGAQYALVLITASGQPPRWNTRRSRQFERILLPQPADKHPPATETSTPSDAIFCRPWLTGAAA
jgi:hypothetical protein